MILDSSKFAKKSAYYYTTVISVILIAPLIAYISILLKIEEAKINLLLEKKAQAIIKSMDSYDVNRQKYYNFPKFESFKAGLYEDNFKAVFTQIKEEFLDHKSGFHHSGDFYYYIVPLPKGFYFNSSYLVVSKKYFPTKIYLFAIGIFSLIVLFLYLFSRYILKKFSKPFEDLNSDLDRFIRDSMHEINTPLSIININSDLANKKMGANKYLKRIKAASKTLSTIYDDMDYLIKNERVLYQKSIIDFSKFLQDRVDYFSEIAYQKNIKIDTMIEENITINFNSTKLQRVIDNTLSNAIKYSYDDNKIVITLKKDKNKIIFSVEDFGIGIKDTKKILNRYYREDHQKGGFGIGLDIVKQIVDKHHIKMEIESTPNKNTIFRYIFKIDNK